MSSSPSSSFFFKFATALISCRNFPWLHARTVLVAVAMVMVIARFKQFLFAENGLTRDCIQVYLAAKAFHFGSSASGGLTMYSPIPQLAELFLPALDPNFLPHTTPYPPLVIAFVSIFVEYISASSFITVWMGMSLVFVLLTFIVLERGLASVRGKNNLSLIVMLVALSYSPALKLDLLWANVSSLVMLMLALSISWLVQGRSVLAGVALSIPFLLKFQYFPIAFCVLIPALRPLSMSFVISLIVILAGNVAVAGLELSRAYFFEILPSLARYYHFWFYNMGVSATFERLIGLTEVRLAGLGINSATAVTHAVFGSLPSIAFLLIIFGSALRARKFGQLDRSLQYFFGVLIVSAVINPIVWFHHLLPLLIPAIWILALCERRSLPRLHLISAGLLIFVIFIDILAEFVHPRALSEMILVRNGLLEDATFLVRSGSSLPTLLVVICACLLLFPSSIARPRSASTQNSWTV